MILLKFVKETFDERRYSRLKNYRSLSDISILITLALKRSRSLKFCNHEAKQVTDKNNEKKKKEKKRKIIIEKRRNSTKR